MSKYILDFENPLRELEAKIETMMATGTKTGVDVTRNVKQLKEKLEKRKKTIYSKLSRWNRVQLARHPKRPHALDYIQLMTNDFFELHGDRNFADDPAIIGGIADFEGESIMVIGQQKGNGTKDNLYRNFGMPRPEGYRKALRLMKLAEKYSIPILTLIDTPGAYPGVGAEERGQGEAIARNLMEMAVLRVPVICVVIGEGASGGALGIGVGDRLLCLENTWYSVITPEGCASILYRDAGKAADAADAMKVSAKDLLEMGIADRLVQESEGSAHLDADGTAANLKKAIREELDQLSSIPPGKLVEKRIQKYEKIGSWQGDN